jgi:microcystin-dependent protein
MASELPPIPYRAALTGKDGFLSAVWADFMRKLEERVGGRSAQTNTELLATIQARLPTGTILDYGGSSAPTGYLLCDGSAVSRTTYADLFAVISTTYGAGDGSTTFNVPNLRDRVSVGKNSSGTFATLGATGGAETAALPNHVHPVSISTDVPSATTDIADSGVGTAMPTGTHTHLVSGNTANPSTNPTSSTLQPYIVLNRIIKT